MTDLGIRTLEQETSLERHIAVDVCNGQPRGRFLMSFCDAFLRADYENFELLRPAMRELIRKYDLRCTCSSMFGSAPDLPEFKRGVE